MWCDSRINFRPLSFLVYINDLCFVCEYTTPTPFTGDTNLFCCGTYLETIEMEINTELTKISTWLKVNNLSLNIKKTHYMIFTRNKFKHQLNRRIDGRTIDEVRKTKFLGVLNLIGKIIYHIRLVIYLKEWHDKKSKTVFSIKVIYPYLIYCNHI